MKFVEAERRYHILAAERKALIEESLRRIDEVRKMLEGNEKADHERVIYGHASPRDSLDLAERQLHICLEELNAGHSRFDYANPSNAIGWLNKAEEYLNS